MEVAAALRHRAFAAACFSLPLLQAPTHVALWSERGQDCANTVLVPRT